jgi:hypothetical protein
LWYKLQVIYIGEQIFRGELKRFGIPYADRLKHVHVVGRTGTGKTSLLAGIALQDIGNAQGVVIFDTTGELSSMVLGRYPRSRINDVVYSSSESVDFADIIAKRKICILNISGSREMGRFVFGKFVSAIKSSKIEHPILCFLDEVTPFIEDSFLEFMSEARRYKVGIIAAHQRFSQIPSHLLDDFNSAFGTTIAFNVGDADGRILERIFEPKFISADFQNIGARRFYTNLMRDRENLPVLLANAIELNEKTDPSVESEILEKSGKLYNIKTESEDGRNEVEESILKKILGTE